VRRDIEIETYVVVKAEFENFAFSKGLERSLGAGACGIVPDDGLKAIYQGQSVRNRDKGSNGSEIGKGTYSEKVEKTTNARKRKSIFPTRTAVRNKKSVFPTRRTVAR